MSQFVLDEATGEGAPGETLYESRGGEPIILIGNVSDIVPGFLVTVTAEDGSQLTYSPCLSLKDGTLNVPEKGVYDFTLYNYEGPGSMAPFMPEKLIGDWVSYEVYDGEGKQYNMSLRFHEDGTMECWYNEPMGEVILHCEGYYYEANGVGEAGQTGEDNVYQYEVTAMGGTAYDPSVPDASLHGAFEVDMWDEGGTIALLHRDGDPLFTGYERENDISLVFSRVVD